MFNKLRNKASSLALVLVLAAMFAGSASAAAVDVTSVTAAIADTLTPIGLIGAGVLLVLVAVKTYKWIRRAM